MSEKAWLGSVLRILLGFPFVFVEFTCGQASTPPVPVFSARGIGPDPSESQQKVAPGMIVSLYGQDLGPETGCTGQSSEDGESYPTELCDTLVIIGDHRAGLLYVQRNQVNLKIPPEAPADTFVTFRVVYQGRSSDPVRVWLAKRIDLPDAPKPAATVEDLWSQLQEDSWDSSFEDWRSRHPNAACRRSQGTSGFGSAQEQWCYRCLFEQDQHSLEWSFYAFEPREPLACRLNQFRASEEGVSEASLEQIHRGLAEKLTQCYGAAKDPGRVPARGSAYKLRRWRGHEREIYLYLAKPLFQPPHLGLLARGKPLLDALTEDHLLSSVHWGTGFQRGGELDRELAEVFEATFPELGNLLAEPVTAGDRREKRRRVFHILLELLEEAQSALPERRAALLLAAHRLADDLALLSEDEEHPGRSWPGFEETRKRLAGFGIEYEWAHFGAGFGNTGNLLWRVWKEHSETRWGERAFLLLQLKGWTKGVSCSYGEENFREVIARGERFLAQRPESRHWTNVAFAVAQAYETWWSLIHPVPMK